MACHKEDDADPRPWQERKGSVYLERHKYMGIAVIKLSGVLASDNSQQAKNALDRLIPRSGKALLDLTKMRYLSSAGLRVLVLACRRAEALGAVIVLTVPDEIREVMVATGFLDRFTVTGTVSDGIDALDRMGRRPHLCQLS
jgi:anti-sigma B factor antagonist